MNQHQFEAIINAIDEPAILINRDYQIVASNQTYMERYNERPKGQTCYAISHGYSVPCDQAGETCPLKQSLESGHRERVLHIHNSSLGREHVDVELTPVTDEDSGEIEYFVEVMRTVLPATKQGKQQMKGYSPAFNRMLDLLNRAANSNITVLLQGQSGTGKELAAEYLHNHSRRSHKPFVIVECSGLNETLFESELFGHEKGAFTGAVNKKIGLAEAAHGGTLFLDEVGDIPLSMQVKLLRLIETHTFRVVGSVVEKQTDFRLVCASHKNLKELVDKGEFREDLYYRISPYPVYLPSLNEREEDIILIAQSLLAEASQSRRSKRINTAQSKTASSETENSNPEQAEFSGGKRLSNEAKQWLRQQRYPGNIRQLRNLIERALLLCDGDTIEVRHLENEPQQTTSAQQPLTLLDAPQDNNIQTLEEVEQAYLKTLMTHYRGDNKTLADKLGISERTLYRKLRKVDA